jgi:ABC-2 type transport system permease protein
MKLKKIFLKYYEIFYITRNELFASPADFIGRLFIHALRISLLGVIYIYVYKSSNKDEINGLTALNAVWAIALVQLIYQSTRNTFTLLKDEILNGQVEVKLNKPYSFIAFSFIESIGQAPIKFLGFSVITITVLGTFFGFPEITLLRITGVTTFYILGVILFTLSQQLIGLFGFWLENPDPIYWITSKLSWIVNGTFIPLAILPVIFRHIADFFPLSAPFFIGRIFEVSNFTVLIKYIGIQVGWIFIFILIINFIYKQGVKRLSIHGG